MLLLAVSGLIDWLDRVLPKAVIRGIQLGLGLKLTHLALGDYVASGGTDGYVLTAPGLPYGFLIGRVGGTLLWYAPGWSERLRLDR
jgi:xanthine/uracil/vitamin C permease (AzgA family)